MYIYNVTFFNFLQKNSTDSQKTVEEMQQTQKEILMTLKTLTTTNITGNNTNYNKNSTDDNNHYSIDTGNTNIPDSDIIIDILTEMTVPITCTTTGGPTYISFYGDTPSQYSPPTQQQSPSSTTTHPLPHSNSPPSTQQ